MQHTYELVLGYQLDKGVFTQQEREQIRKLANKAHRERGYGVRERMPFGRTLAELRDVMQKEPGAFIELTTLALEATEREVYYRIQLSATWDAIEARLGDLPVEMPTAETHIAALFPLKKLEQRAEAWFQFRSGCDRDKQMATAEKVALYVEKFAALPVESTKQSDMFEEKKETLSESDDNMETKELADELAGVSLDGTTQPVASAEQPGSGPEYARSQPAIDAINRIGRICGPEWKAALLKDPLKVLDKDIIAWAAESDENVLRISNLIGEKFTKGVQRSIKYLHHVVDEKTTAGDMKNRCIAEGGRWEHEMVGFKFTVERMV